MKKYQNTRDKQGRRRELPEDIQMAVLEALVRPEVELHFQLNPNRITTYEVMREEVVGFAEAKCGVKHKERNVQAPKKAERHDAGALVKAKGASSQGKCVLTARFEGECYHCGKWGHRAFECWSKESGKSGGIGSASAAAQTVANVPSAAQSILLLLF